MGGFRLFFETPTEGPCLGKPSPSHQLKALKFLGRFMKPEIWIRFIFWPHRQTVASGICSVHNWAVCFSLLISSLSPPRPINYLGKTLVFFYPLQYHIYTFTPWVKEMKYTPYTLRTKTTMFTALTTTSEAEGSSWWHQSWKSQRLGHFKWCSPEILGKTCGNYLEKCCCDVQGTCV